MGPGVGSGVGPDLGSDVEPGVGPGVATVSNFDGSSDDFPVASDDDESSEAYSDASVEDYLLVGGDADVGEEPRVEGIKEDWVVMARKKDLEVLTNNPAE